MSIADLKNELIISGDLSRDVEDLILQVERELTAAQTRIAELERERNYLVNVLYKAREDCMETFDCRAGILLDQTCGRYPATGKKEG